MSWEVRIMPSRTSCFNRTLFRKNLSRFWPLWGGASFLGALFPLAMLLQLVRQGGIRDSMANRPPAFTEMYYGVVAYGLPVLSLLYAILCAMLVWSYLYNARSVGLMHTLPITRRGLFVTNFLSGMAMLLIPYAITGGLCVLITLAYGGFDGVGLLVTVLGVLGESFFYFATATFAAFMVGNVFALPALYFLLHFLAVLLDWILSMFAGNFIFGLDSYYSGVVEWLSPTVYLMEKVRLNCTYEEVAYTGAVTGANYTHDVLTAVSLEGFWLVGVYALVGAGLVAFAYLLYVRRRSESAGDVVAVGWMKPFFRFGLAALAALLGGQALYALFWESFQDGAYYDALPMAVCMLVAGTIGYYAASMLLAKSLRVFRGSWPGLAVVAVGCIGLCCVMHFDLLGISRRVPEASELEKVVFYAADNTYTLRPGEDAALLEQVRTVHKAIVADQTYIQNLRDMGMEEEKTYTFVRLEYKLKSGLKVERRYSLPMTRARLAQPDTYDGLLDTLVNSEAMKTRRLHAGDSGYTLRGGGFYLESSGKNYDLNTRECEAILNAVTKDAAAGTWGDYDWFDRNNNGAYAMSMELQFEYYEGDVRYYDWIDIVVRPGMVNTVDCLKELGLVTDGELVIREDMEKSEDWEKYYGEKYGDSYEEASIGVIGGADGPTAVYVAGVTA